MPTSKFLTTFGIAKESVENTAVAPTRFFPVMSESMAVSGAPIMVEGATGSPHQKIKSQAGAFSVAGAFSSEIDPIMFGELMFAAFGSGTAATASNVGTHTFVRLGSTKLPTHTVWANRSLDEVEFTGMMISKLSISLKKGEAAKFTADWVGRGRGTSLGTQAATYGTVQPFTFSMGSLVIAGTAVANYDSLDIVIDNKTKADHTIGTSQFPSQIWTEGFDITISGELYAENYTEYAKYLAGGTTSVNLDLVHSANVTGSIPYRLAFAAGAVAYESIGEPMMDSPNGPFKVKFSGAVLNPPGSSFPFSGSIVNNRVTIYG